jgi:cytochrome c oxidase assembly factor CtaG
LWIAVGSSLAGLDHELLSLHMVQHLLLSTVSAPLLLLGEPVLLFTTSWTQRSVPAACSYQEERSKRIVIWLTHPAFCWLVAVGTLLLWHIPRVFELAMQWPLLHVVQQISFFATGMLFWWPVLRPWPGAPAWPRWSIPLYLLLATLPCDALSAFLTFCDRVVYPGYLNGPSRFPISPLQDQECAGALMWVWVTIVYLVPAVFITLQILAPSVPGAQEDRRAA